MNVGAEIWQAVTVCVAAVFTQNILLAATGDAGWDRRAAYHASRVSGDDGMPPACPDPDRVGTAHRVPVDDVTAAGAVGSSPTEPPRTRQPLKSLRARRACSSHSSLAWSACSVSWIFRVLPAAFAFSRSVRNAVIAASNWATTPSARALASGLDRLQRSSSA